MFAALPRAMLTGLTFLTVFSPIRTDTSIAESAKCQPYKVPVEVDPPNHGYKPYYVVMHRCRGGCQSQSPQHCECVAATEKTVKISVLNMPLGIIDHDLQNHTSCKNRCISSFKKTCKKGGHQWNENTCTCACPNAPRQAQCNGKQQWDSGKCQCICKVQSQACPNGMDWNDSLCGCQCNMNMLSRCSRIGKATNYKTCRCEHTQAAVTGQSASKQLNGSETKLVAALVVIGLLLATLFVIDLILMCSKKGFIYGLFTKCNENKDSPSFTREETDTGSVMLDDDSIIQDKKRNGHCKHNNQSSEAITVV